MAFKIPAPMHGWRAFAGEVGVIVLGVLLALGAQEAVTNWNDRQRADEAKAAIRSEVGDHEFTAAEMEITLPCITAQAEEIQKRLVAGDRRPLTRRYDKWNKVGFVLRMPGRDWSDTAWQSIRDTDALRQFDPAFASGVANHYGQVAKQQEHVGRLQPVLGELNGLSLMMPTDEVERLRMIQVAEQVRSTADSLERISMQIRDRLAALGLSTPTAELERKLGTLSGTIVYCRANGYPLAKLRAPDPKSPNI